MTPGPTRIPDRVQRAGLEQLHHRTAEFSASLDETLGSLRPLFGTTAADVLPVHGTGRAAMEGAIVNFFAPGDRVVACCNGKFGEMWAGFADSYGLEVERVALDWGRSVDPAEVEAALARTPRARAVLVVHSDSSTGALNPVAEVARAAREAGALTLVDGISAVGGTPLRFDDWALDFAVTASQKCLMSGAGLSFAVVGPDAWAASARAGFPRHYLSFEAIRDALAGPRPETPGTTPVALVLQVREALRMVHAEGLQAVYARHDSMAASARRRALGLGCTLLGEGIAERSPTLTALVLPAERAPRAVRDALRAEGILVAGGLGRFSEGCIRIGHMGDIRPADLERTLDALARALG